MKNRKKVISSLLVVVLLLQILGVGAAFGATGKGTDEHWASEKISSWLAKGWAAGYPNGDFEPENEITRAEFVKLVNKSFDMKSIQKEVLFSDVKSSDWFYDQVVLGVSNGYIQGYPDRTFKPRNFITRQEVAQVLVHLSNLKETNGEVTDFTDKEQIAQWAESAVKSVVSNQIMKGYPDGSFRPSRPVTRAEAIVVLDNLLVVLSEKAKLAPSIKDTSSSDSSSSDSGSDSSYSRGIRTKAELLEAVKSTSTGTISIAANINLGDTVLDINRPVTLHGNGYTLTGSVSVHYPDTTLNNLTITQDLVLGEGIGDGNVTLERVVVQNDTLVRGGGAESIYIKDSILTYCYVNKQNGIVRLVALGNTQVEEIQLETPAKIVESELSQQSAGFANVVIPVNFRNTQGVIELMGTFDSVISRASEATLIIADTTVLHNLMLNAATEVVGLGIIELAQINAIGCSLAILPVNLILEADMTVNIGGEVYENGYSQSEQTSIANVQITPASIHISLNSIVVGLLEEDFNITATLDGEAVELQNLEFGPSRNRFTFTPVDVKEYMGKEFIIQVGPSDTSVKLTGEPKIASCEISPGLEGRFVDISGIGVGGLKVRYSSTFGETPGSIVVEATTSPYGYYSISVPPGNYRVDVSGRGYISSTYAVEISEDVFQVEDDRVIVRGAGTEEVKIVLTWGEQPEDLDSHLVGSDPEDAYYRTWYFSKEYVRDGVIFAELDLDDTDSFGPETTTIRQLSDGTYKFYVHRFSGEGSLRNSLANVQVFIGNNTNPTSEFQIPSGEGEEEYWFVFELLVSENGSRVEINPVNQILDSVDFPIERSLLEYRLADAEDMLESASIGTDIGQYPQEAVVALQGVINQTWDLIRAADTSNAIIGEAYRELEESVEEFKNSIIVPQGQVTGQILQSTTQVPIEGCEISVYDLNSNLLGSAISDADGQYNLLTPVGEGYRVVATMVGYISHEFNDIVVAEENPVILNFTLETSSNSSPEPEFITHIPEGYELQNIHLDGNIVVGSVHGDEITDRPAYVYNLETEEFVELGNGSFPRVSGDKVVFRHGSNLKLYNAETGIISEITNYDGVNGGIGSSRGFDIDGNRVVYNDTSGRIHLINLESGQSEIIAEREGVRKLDPRIDGNKVVWLEVGEESFIYDIALFDLETRTKSIIAENKGISELNFEESKVMYVQSNGEGAGVHFYDLLTGNTEFLGSGHSVSVTGNKFVFIQDNRLKVYDLSNGEAYLVKQRENAWQFRVVAAQDRIVWAEVFYPGDGTIVRSVYFGNLE